MIVTIYLVFRKNRFQNHKWKYSICFNSVIPISDESYVVDFTVNNEEQVTIAYWNHSVQNLIKKNGAFLNYVIKPENQNEEYKYFQSISIDQFETILFILDQWMQNSSI